VGVEDRENAIGESGFGVMVRSPGSVLVVLLLAIIFFVVGCGGGDQAQKAEPPPTPPEDKAADPKAADPKPADPNGGGAPKGDPKGAPGGNAAGGATVQSTSNAETLDDSPFELNQRQPIPPDFRAAYQRRALIVVQFFKENPDSTRGIEYPQGIRPDSEVDQALTELRADYPQIEFFAYDIAEPGEAETSENLDQGEYGTLAAQLEVGYTPFVAMLAPRGQGYVVENLFQGYVDRGVLDQALFDLTRADVGGNSSDIDIVLDRVELDHLTRRGLERLVDGVGAGGQHGQLGLVVHGAGGGPPSPRPDVVQRAVAGDPRRPAAEAVGVAVETIQVTGDLQPRLGGDVLGVRLRDQRPYVPQQARVYGAVDGAEGAFVPLSRRSHRCGEFRVFPLHAFVLPHFAM